MNEYVVNPQSNQETALITAYSQATKSFAINEQDWVEAEGIRAFMIQQKKLLYATFFVSIFMSIFLYQHVNKMYLFLWFASSVIFTSYRYWLTTIYERNSRLWDSADVLAFRAQHAWTWTLSGVVWGATLWLYYASAPEYIQSLAGMCIVCVAISGALAYIGHFKTFMSFLTSLVLTVIAVILWKSYVDTSLESNDITYATLPLVLIFWMMITLQGKHLCVAFTQSVLLRKGNMELIDSLKAETERAVKAIDMKNRLLASAAHDIRQPVLALDLYANLLRSDPRMADTLTPKITVATRSVVEMFDSLFDLSRLETGQIQIHKSNIDVASFMNELFLQYQPAAQLKGLELRLHTCQTYIYSDPQLLKRVIGNLTANAIKFTEKNGVLLACRKTSQGVCFEVWDTGMGIASEQQQAVFREFYKAPLIANAPIGMNDGFGLGLSIVARFCEALGHKFSMRSTLDKGSVFRIMVEASPADVHKI